MRVTLLNVRILFQKSTVSVDAIGNHVNAWENYYRCYAAPSGESGSERASTGQTIADAGITFTVRYCQTAAAITSDRFRILFDGKVYNIVSIDHLNFKREVLKFKCKMVSNDAENES